MKYLRILFLFPVYYIMYRRYIKRVRQIGTLLYRSKKIETRRLRREAAQQYFDATHMSFMQFLGMV